MLDKILTLACALFGLLTAVSLEAWLRSRIAKNATTTDTYKTVRNRNSEYWSNQYLPLIIMLAVVAAAIGFAVSPWNAAVFFGGAVLCFVSVILGSRTVISGSISSSSLAASGDVRGSLRTAYRSAAVMGLFVTSFALIGLGSLFLFLDTEKLISLIASFGLGASITSLCLNLSGTAFSGAYALSVKSDDYTDYTGMFIGSGSDFVETYILSACAAALLAGVGVDASGVTSTFTISSAIKYPLIILAAGIAASIPGILAYRGRIVKNPASGITAGNYVSAVIVIAAALYFSKNILQSYVYGFCVAAGIVAAVACGEIAKLFSYDGLVFRKNVPDARTVGASQSMIYSLSIGMMSVVIPAAVTITAMVVSYKFANFYGVALASIGINSMAGVNSAVRGFSINTASSSEITSVIIDSDESPNPADVLLTASVRTDVIGKTYSAVATIITLTAMFTALSIAAGSPSADLMNTSVFLGIATGAVFVFVCAGFIIRSIRLTATVLRERLDDLYDDEKHINTLRGLVPLYAASLIVPAIAGALGGITGIIAFTCSVTVTGMCMLYAFNNSGKYFDRMATETLGNVIKVMVVAAIVFAPVFMKFGGVL